MRLAADNLGRRRGGRMLVDDITLTIAPGERLGLVGPNGSGKSTLLRLLAGLDRPSAGAVYLGTRDLRRMRQRAIARHIAFVTQQAATQAPLSVREIVALGRIPFQSSLKGASQQDLKRVTEALAQFDLLGLADRTWPTLSGGERQRVQLARALAQHGDILILDEPTNHLDIAHQLAILSYIQTIPATVVVALHDLNQAMQCDRVGVMDNGRLVALGPPEVVLTRERLAATFGVNVQFITPGDGERPVIRFQPS